MLRALTVLALVGFAAAASMDSRPARPSHAFAQERDGAHHGGGSSSSSYSAPSNTYSAPSNTYSAPAPANTYSAPAPANTYSAPAPSNSYSAPAPSNSYSAPASHSSSGGEQGNLYYYYYPVDEYGSTEAADAGFDIFTAIILPLVILGGLLLALSSLTFTFTGRAMRDNVEPGITEQLQTEVERIFYVYLNAFESDSCIQRAVCQSGIYSKSFKHKDFFMSMAEPFVPETMQGNMAIFKMAAKDGFDIGKCKKYKCTAPKIFQ